MPETKLSSISQSNSPEKIGEFWDDHDFTDYDTDAPDVNFDISCAVNIETNLYNFLEQEADKKGINIETLVNLWLQEKLINLS